VPEGTAEQWRWFTDMMRRATSPQTALRMLRLWQTIDVSDLARQVRCPTLVLHAQRDAIVPYEEGKLMASLIPDAEFVTLDSANHVILEDEPAWPHLLAELRRFLPALETAESADPSGGFGDLTEREREVLDLIAQGLGNDDIGQRLAISPKTVRNHITNIFGKLGATTRAQVIVRAQRLLGWLPNAEGLVLPGATHLLHVQNPRGMAEALASFFARHPMVAGAP